MATLPFHSFNHTSASTTTPCKSSVRLSAAADEAGGRRRGRRVGCICGCQVAAATPLTLSAHAAQNATIPAAIPFIEAHIRNSMTGAIPKSCDHNLWLYSQHSDLTQALPSISTARLESPCQVHHDMDGWKVCDLIETSKLHPLIVGQNDGSWFIAYCCCRALNDLANHC